MNLKLKKIRSVTKTHPDSSYCGEWEKRMCVKNYHKNGKNISFRNVRQPIWCVDGNRNRNFDILWKKRNLKQNTNIWRAVWWNVCWTIFWMEFYKWKWIWEVFGIFTDENSSKLNYISLLNISMVSRFSNSVLSVEDSCGFFFLISSEFNSFYELLDLISLNAILEVPKGNIP